MHQIITKSLLLLTIVLAIVAIATPDWQVQSEKSSGVGASANMGLFKACGSASVANVSATSCASIPASDSGDKGKDLKACQGLGIASVCFLFVALGCEFAEGYKSCRMIGAVSYVVGLILMIACLALYGAKVKQSGMTYGYSFDLAIGAVVTGVLAGVSAVLSGNYGPHGHLPPGLRPPRLHRQTAV